jgi:hypothetical protein
VHSRDTRSALDLESTLLKRNRRGAGSRSGLDGGTGTRSVLATLTAVGGGVTTVSVHGAASTLGPVTADSVAELGTTASVGSGLTGWLGGGHSRRVT